MTAPFAFPYVLSILELSFLSSAFFKVFEDYETRLVKLIFTVECGLCYPFSPFPLSPFFFLFVFLKPSMNRQVSMEAIEELWPELLSGMFQSLHCPLWASSCHPSWKGLSFPLPPVSPLVLGRKTTFQGR